MIQGDTFVRPEILSMILHLAALVDKLLDGFFKLEREHFEKNTVRSVLNLDGTEVFTREEIEEAHVNFYSHLFFR